MRQPRLTAALARERQRPHVPRARPDVALEQTKTLHPIRATAQRMAVRRVKTGEAAAGLIHVNSVNTEVPHRPLREACIRVAPK
jgi:hypothetical protein